MRPDHTVLRARRAVLAPSLAFSFCWFVACTSQDEHPPPAPTGDYCSTWTCVEPPDPIAAIAVEQSSGADGGSTCASWRWSLPEGDDAFTSIRQCGGNQVRCGTADYRVGAAEPGTRLSCTVAYDGTFHLFAELSIHGTTFDVRGDLAAIKSSTDGGQVTATGSVTLSAGSADAGTVGPLTCRLTKVPYIWRGTILADFDCGPEGDAAGACAVRGTFVFEDCMQEGDGGY